MRPFYHWTNDWVPVIHSPASGAPTACPGDQTRPCLSRSLVRTRRGTASESRIRSGVRHGPIPSRSLLGRHQNTDAQKIWAPASDGTLVAGLLVGLPKPSPSWANQIALTYFVACGRLESRWQYPFGHLVPAGGIHRPSTPPATCRPSFRFGSTPVGATVQPFLVVARPLGRTGFSRALARQAIRCGRAPAPTPMPYGGTRCVLPSRTGRRSISMHTTRPHPACARERAPDFRPLIQGLHGARGPSDLLKMNATPTSLRASVLVPCSHAGSAKGE